MRFRAALRRADGGVPNSRAGGGKAGQSSRSCMLEVSRLRRRKRYGACNPSRKFGKAAGGPGARKAREGVHGGRFGFVLEFAAGHPGVGGGSRACESAGGGGSARYG